MPATARQFEPHVTRSGGAPSKYRFTIRCSECSKADIYEAGQPVRDDVVRGYFKDRGWLLGRDRIYDMCPACLKAPRGTQQLHHASDRPKLAVPTRQSDRGPAPVDQRGRDTADILARHLGKPEALAAEVFRPREAAPPRSSAPAPREPSTSISALSPEAEQALTEMAADLRSLRSTVELMAEQMNKLITFSGQQVGAIARLAPLLVRSTEGQSGELKEIVNAVQSISNTPRAAVEQQLGRETTPELETSPLQDQKISSTHKPVQVLETTDAPEPVMPQKNERKARLKTPKQVVVKSIADTKRSNRFYTTVRLSRELWNRSGLGPDDRIQIDWNGKTLSISRDPESGVKPKSVGDATVVLQSWRLGDLNFARAKVTTGTASLRLTALP